MSLKNLRDLVLKCLQINLCSWILQYDRCERDANKFMILEFLAFLKFHLGSIDLNYMDNLQYKHCSLNKAAMGISALIFTVNGN